MPNMLDGGRLHGREAVRAYWARQFTTGRPLVRLEGLRSGTLRSDLRKVLWAGA
ncbi:hypothetical protein [Streptomyces sp. A2-16]|uniref:hypothetical protein n=1 Tax=Streptomyces sp. A2-16 TaxID=2781734 RepID=UPI002010EC1B|nr:hypothetical protein [Streptomyces sp. A2-16]